MEFEVSVFNFDYKKIINRIKTKGKKIHGFYPFQISYFYLLGEKDFKKGFLRVRDEYPGKVTITTKILSGKYPEEYEIEVNSDYQTTVQVIEKSGLKKKLDSIKLREKWSFSKCHEIVFDLWPGLPLAMEVDCGTEKDLINALKYLKIDLNDTFTNSKYEYLYGIPLRLTQSMSDLNFKNYKKYLQKHIKKNKNKFNTLSTNYYKSFMTKAISSKYSNIF